MTDAQWHCIHSFLIAGSDVRVGNEDHCRLFVEALRWMARRGGPLAPVVGRVRQEELGLSPLGPRVRPGRLAYLQVDPDLSAVRLDSTVGAHT